MLRQRIVIDCDPGHDDAVALLMALAVPQVLDIAGITTVAGNIDVAQAERNASAVCAIAGRLDIPVRAGCSRPLVNPFRDASDFHGHTGLDGLGQTLAPPAAHPEHAVDFIIATLMASSEPVTLVCLAPLTNIAVALVKAPTIASKVKEIVFMGGARRSGGNVAPCATFNVVCDPHAAHVVFESGCPLSVVSLDATCRVIVGADALLRLHALGSSAAQAASRILEYFNRRRVEVYGYAQDQTSLNDPCVIAFLLDRALFTGTDVNVAIEHRSELTMGMTVVDLLRVSGRRPNARWLDGVDSAGVLRLLTSTLGRYPRRSHDALFP